MMNKEELRNEILQLMYDKGYRYIARDGCGSVHIYKTSPEKRHSYWANGDLFVRLYFTDNLFEDVKFEDKEPLDIAEELGIVDWATIPKDTKVLVSNDGEKWYKKHFKQYKEDCVEPFVVYCFGNTSWTSETITAYKYCKLAEEEE